MLLPFIALCRPHFLLGGILLYALGALAAGVDDPRAYLVGQLAVTATQLTAHLVNEYADLEADRLISNRTLFSGGSGVLVAGAIEPVTALRAAWSSTTVAVVAAGILAVEHPVASLVVAGALMISWAYSMPPVRLTSTGWGELATSIVVTLAVPFTGASIQGPIPPVLVWAMIGLLPIHIAMMLAFEIPDIESDRRAGKDVLAVRIGLTRTRRLIGALLLAGSGTAVLGAAQTGRPLAWMLLAIPAGAVIVTAARGGRHALLTTAAALSLGLATLGAIVAVVA